MGLTIAGVPSRVYPLNTLVSTSFNKFHCAHLRAHYQHGIEGSMNQKLSLNVGLLFAALLTLLYLIYALTHPFKMNLGARRITAVNAAPTIVVSFTLSNIPAANEALPLPNKP